MRSLSCAHDHIRVTLPGSLSPKPLAALSTFRQLLTPSMAIPLVWCYQRCICTLHLAVVILFWGFSGVAGGTFKAIIGKRDSPAICNPSSALHCPAGAPGHRAPDQTASSSSQMAICRNRCQLAKYSRPHTFTASISLRETSHRPWKTGPSTRKDDSR